MQPRKRPQPPTVIPITWAPQLQQAFDEAWARQHDLFNYLALQHEGWHPDDFASFDEWGHAG